MSLHYDDLGEDFHRDYLSIQMDPDILVCLIPSMYVGMCSPALGPAVLPYGADVAVRHLRICQVLTQ
jgi:hypothetical protein